MASQTGLGDIPGNRLTHPILNTHASVASGGANALLGPQFGPFPFNIRVRNVWWTPTGGDTSATKSATYRRLTLINGGTAGAGTTIIASLNQSATVASLVPASLTVDTTATVASGNVLNFSQATVGGTDANGTVLLAGQFAISYEVI